MTNLQFTPAYPFEVTLEADGRVHFVQGPDDEGMRGGIVQVIAQTQPFGDAWASDYRTSYVLSGAAGHSVATLENVRAIAVPHWRRIRGQLEGNQLTFTGVEVSADGQAWEPFPEVQDVGVEALHPAFALPGKVVGQFFTLHWREGRIDIEPDPPAELLELLESVVQNLNGEDDAEWTARHLAFGGPANVRPDAKRGTIEVREFAPLFSPSNPPMQRVGGLEFWPLVPLEYSADGKKWARYAVGGDEGAGELPPAAPASPALAAQDDPAAALAALLKGEAGTDADDGDDGEDPFGMLSSLFDLQAVPVTVYADGRVEWPEGEIEAGQAEALRQSILNTTGAGDPGRWAQSMSSLVPEGEEGVPSAVRLQVMKALLGAAPGMLDQSYAPTALSMDGEHWHELSPLLGLDDDEDEDGL